MQSHVIPREVVLQHVNRAKVFEFAGRLHYAERARRVPLPGAAGKAFTSGPIKAGMFTVSRIAPAHWALLQAVDSPLIKMYEGLKSATAENGEKKSNADWTTADQWNACHIMTGDIEAIYETLETKGAAQVVKDARKSFGMNPDAAPAINPIIAAILEQMKRHIETIVQYAAEMESEGQVSFFLEPPEKN